MKNKQYDIFISYRRDGGFETADAIAQRLGNAGYRVFFDLESLRSGKFNIQLYKVIDNCKDFVVILPKGGLDRCENEDDWVRLEVARAIKANKNIIPVMLRGFDFPKTLPEDIDELRFYQGVEAGNPNFFIASVEKLKGLLASKKGFTWGRYKKYIIAAFALVLIGVSIGYYDWWHRNKEYVTLCKGISNRMGAQLISINGALGEVDNIYEEWDRYTKKLNERRNPSDTARLRNDFFALVNHYKSNASGNVSPIVLSDNDKSLLRRKGVDVEDIEGYFSLAMPGFYEELGQMYEALLVYGSPSFYFSDTESWDKEVRRNKEYMNLSAESIYCYYLGVMSTMPKDVYEVIAKFKNNLTKLPDIDFDKPSSYYEDKCTKINNVLQEMTFDLGIKLDKAQKELNKEENNLNSLIDKSKEQEKQDMAERLVRIERGRAEVEIKKGELAEADLKLTEVYESALKKFELHTDDDQWYMWGKVLRIATLATNSQAISIRAKKDYEEKVEIAKSKGLDPSFITMYTPLITLEEKFLNVDKWLNNYLKFNQSKDPNATKYVASTKQYFKEIYKGTLSYRGILITGTENNVPHPVYNVGDIVIERKGKPVSSFEDYRKLNDDPALNTVKIIRFTDGKMRIVTETIPADCKILVGFVNLKESEE